MEWIDHMNEAVHYIEEHLTEELDYGELARTAWCSAYHFQRMFAYMAGIPLSEYIRRRRMSKAAADLKSGDEKIVDIALKYGYASPTAFNRAFQSIHGIAPSAARKESACVKSYPPLSFKFTIKGVEELNYRIEKKEAFRIVGISSPMHREIEKNFDLVPQMWRQAAMDGTIPRLVSLSSLNPAGVMGVSVCGEEEVWKYFIAVASVKPIDETMDEYTVPAMTYAIFPGAGVCPQAIQELEQRIVTEWLPASGYEYANGPDIELYISPDPMDSVFEVWIPVVKAGGDS